MCAAFLKQYEYNTKLEVSIRNLELTKQKPNESFSDFLTRFMNKAGLMKNKLAEKDQVRMIVRNVSPNLVERLQMMNPKTFVDLYDDGLQAEEMENEKKKNTRNTGTRNYPTEGTQQANTSRAMEVQAVQEPRRFSNFNQPLSKVLEHLVQKGLLRPLINVKPLSSNSPGYDPNSYCNFHQAIGHPTDTCIRLKNEFQNLIESGKITDPENPNTRTNPFPKYQSVPPPATKTINSAARKEEMKKSLEAPCRVEGLLRQPSGKFDYKVFYSKPPSYDIPIESIVPGGWGDEFKDDKPESEKKRAETPKQPHRGIEDLLGQPSGKFDYKVFYSKPPSYDIPLETIMPTGWGDEFEDKGNEGYNVWIDNTEVNYGHQE